MPQLFCIASVISLHAPSLLKRSEEAAFGEWLTNSIFVSAIVSAFVIWFCRRATRHMTIVPGADQNRFESVVQALYDMLEGIVGRHMIGRTFSLLATLFVFILAANWFGLLPGVGSIGWGEPGEKLGMFHNLPHVETPLLRPATADLNMTLAMALIFMCLWFYWTMREVGLKKFIIHTFGVKGGATGILAFFLFFIFLFVGAMEVVSILIRPVALSLRLYGNVFAGENLLSSMIMLGRDLNLPEWVSYIASVTLPVPFYFLELLVGVLQAFVFMLLCAVYIQLSTSHDEEEAH